MIDKIKKLKREQIRRKLSALLMDTDEQHPMECYYVVGDAYSCGLSTLLMPTIVSMFQEPSEGIIWFQFEGEQGLREFDDMIRSDLNELLEQLIDDCLIVLN
jgi:hypothetical protein